VTQLRKGNIIWKDNLQPNSPVNPVHSKDVNSDDVKGELVAVRNELQLVKNELEAVKGILTDGSQKVQITTFERDAIARACEKIVDTIGADHIALFLTGWSEDGKYRDLLRSDITFSAVGDVTDGTGPFGACPVIGSSGGYLKQDAVTEHTTGGGILDLSSPNHKVAVRLEEGLSCRVRRATFRLRRTGSLTGVTSIKATIYTDDNGIPGAPVVEKTYAPLVPPQMMSGSFVFTTVGDVGLAFDTPVTLSPDARYWLVLEYAPGAAVDGDNRVRWNYQDGASYDGGQCKSAVYDGSTWTVTDGRSMHFSLYTDDLDIEGTEATFISMAQLDSANSGSWSQLWRIPLRSFRATNNSVTGGEAYALMLDGSVWKSFMCIREAYANQFNAPGIAKGYRLPGDAWHSYAVVLSGDWSKDRHRFYMDARLMGRSEASEFDGENDLQLPILPEPWIYGTGKDERSVLSLNGGWRGALGPMLLVKRALSERELATVHTALMPLRYFEEVL